MGSGDEPSIGLGSADATFEDDVDEHCVSGDGVSSEPSGLCTGGSSACATCDGTTDSASFPLRFAIADFDLFVTVTVAAGFWLTSGSLMTSSIPSTEFFLLDGRPVSVSCRLRDPKAPDKIGRAHV